MRILICSDIHGNWEALQAMEAAARALPGGYDRLFCLGDLVDYGPNPRECVRWIRDHAAACVRGNHDHAVGYGADCRCTPAYRRLSETTRAATLPLLEDADLEYLRGLPEQIYTRVGRVRFLLTHATVHDPLFGYLAAGEEAAWAAELAGVEADAVLTGHTHVGFTRRVGDCWLVNPGSVGQSKTDGGRACFAIWDDGAIQLHSVPYDFSRTQARLAAWREVPPDVRAGLEQVLATGGLPA